MCDGRYCIICGQSKGPTNRVFEVPKDEKRRQIWSESCGRFLKTRSFVCSRHFPPEHLGCKKLKGGAVPCLRLQHPNDKDHYDPCEVKVEEEDSVENGKDIHDTEAYEVKIESDDSNSLFDAVKKEEVDGPDIYHYHVERVQAADIYDYTIGSVQQTDLKEERVDPLNPKQQKCYLCNYTTEHELDLKKHIDSIHLKLEPLKCHMCNYVTFKDSSLKKHIDSIHLNLNHGCHLCDYTAKKEIDLERHLELVHLNVKQYKCNSCDYSANDKYYLKRHIARVHLKLRRYKCELCQFLAFDSSHLNNHINNVHFKTPRKHKCMLCDFATRRKLDLKHMRSVHMNLKQHDCHLCDFTTRQGTRLRKHVISVHSDSIQCNGELNGENLTTALDEQVSSCKLCDFATTQKTSLEEHEKYVHLDSNQCDDESSTENLPVNVENGLDTTKSNFEPHYCRQCEFKVEQKCSLEEYVKFDHSYSSQCNLETSAENLLSNVKNQLDATQSNFVLYYCQQCDFKTEQKTSLEEHYDDVHSDSNQRNGDSNGENLPIDMKNRLNTTQLNFELYYCQQCEFKTEQKTSLEEHIDDVHSDSNQRNGDSNGENLPIDMKNRLNTTQLNFELYYCQQCDFKTEQKTSLEEHIDDVHSDSNQRNGDSNGENLPIDMKNRPNTTQLNFELYYCQQCEFKTEQKTSLEEHIDDVHSDSNQINSDSNGENLPIDMKNRLNTTQLNFELYYCQQCDFKTKQKASLEEHIDTVHLDLNRSNGESKADNLPINMENRLNTTQSNFELYYCKRCDFEAKQKISLEEHIASVHSLSNKSNSVSNSENLPTNSENVIDIIQLDSELHYCHVCNFVTKEKTSLEEHIDFVHLNSRQQSTDSNTENLIINPGNQINIQLNSELNYCHLCEFAAEQKIDLDKHISSIHLDTRQINGESNVGNIKIDPDSADHGENIDCRACELIETEEGNLESHVNTFHSKLKRHKCLSCDYTASKKAAIRRHTENIHLNLKKHKCSMCGYAANQKRSLKRHVEFVHMNLQQKCNFCDYATKEKVTLRRHVECVHLNLKPHKCHLCDFTANQRGSIKFHIDSVHLNIRKHKCSFCDYTTNVKCNLKKHIDIQHLNPKQHRCLLCDYVSKKITDIEKHLSSVHLK